MNAKVSDNPVPPSLRDVWMSIDEASQELGVNRDTVGRRIRAGVLVRMKYGRNVFVSRASVKRYLDQFRHAERA